LPNVPDTHPLSKEWKIRRRSSDCLLQYIARRNSPLRILEVGCGNGWLSARMAKLASATVIGSDINFQELQQAATVFSDYPNLHFLYGDIRSGILNDGQFDIILFAASIQYFPDLEGLIIDCLALLSKDGEIHVLDSPFYDASEIRLARQRTIDYYQAMGMPEMSQQYFHHSIDSIHSFKWKYQYKPSGFPFGWMRRNPFPWIIIEKKEVQQ